MIFYDGKMKRVKHQYFANFWWVGSGGGMQMEGESREVHLRLRWWKWCDDRKYVNMEGDKWMK